MSESKMAGGAGDKRTEEDSGRWVHLVLHRDMDFEDDVIYLDGHSYVNCGFSRCTFIYRGGISNFVGPRIESCVIVMDVTLYDLRGLEGAKQILQLAEAMLTKNAGGTPDLSAKPFKRPSDPVGTPATGEKREPNGGKAKRRSK